jgi:hypothetical protein
MGSLNTACLRGSIGSAICAIALALACSDDSGGDTPGASGTGSSSAAGQGGSGIAGSGGSKANGGSAGSGGSGVAGTAGAAGGAIDTTGKEEVWTDAIASEGLSCDEVCAETGNECAPVCGDDDDTAVDTLYRFVGEGGLALQKQPTFDFCDQPPAPTMTFNMGTDEYTLIGFRCCCLAPAVNRVMGDPANRITCNEVCDAEGLTCHEETDWGVGTSGMLQTFSAVPNEMRLILGDCDEVPLASVNRIGVDEPLVEYQCGCVP